MAGVARWHVLSSEFLSSFLKCGLAVETSWVVCWGGSPSGGAFPGVSGCRARGISLSRPRCGKPKNASAAAGACWSFGAGSLASSRAAVGSSRWLRCTRACSLCPGPCSVVFPRCSVCSVVFKNKKVFLSFHNVSPHGTPNFCNGTRAGTHGTRKRRAAASGRPHLHSRWCAPDPCLSALGMQTAAHGRRRTIRKNEPLALLKT